MIGLTKTGLAGLEGITIRCVPATCADGSWLICTGAWAKTGCAWAVTSCRTGVAACDEVAFSACASADQPSMTTPRLAAKIPLFQANPKPPLDASFLRGVSEGGTRCVRFVGSVIAKSPGLKDDHAVALKLLVAFVLVFAKERRA